MTQLRLGSSPLVTSALLLCAAAIAALVTLVLSNNSTLLNGWDDMRWKFLPARESSQIVLVDIDEQSLARQGRWPWPRTRLADLLELLLDEHGAAVVGVDIILSEPGDEAGDLRLAALDRERVVWAHAASMGNEPPAGQGVLTAAPRCPPASPWNQPVRGWLGLTPAIAGDTFRAGHIRPWPDGDSIVRTYQPFLAFGPQCIPALGLAMYSALLGTAVDAPLHRENGDWQWSGIPLGLEDSGLMRLIWRTPAIRAISAHDILSETAQLPRGAVMVVGSSALGIGDFVSIPGVERFAGVGIHALALRQWLDREFVAMPPYHDWLAWGLLIPVFAIFWRTSTAAASRPWIVAAILFASWNLLALALWRQGVYFAAEPMLWALLWLPPIQGWRLWQEKRTSRRIYRQFHAYLPEKVLQELIASGVDPRQLEAEFRDITVLFADLRGFTTLSENMTPREVVTLLNEVMEHLSFHIGTHEGTLDKFMGDSVMAFWGAPVAMDNHADRAVSCAIAMLDNLDTLNDTLRSKGLPPVALGIGINSGQVAVGNMGSASRKNYSAVGDAVNIAARLQQLSKSLDCYLLIGADTAVLCRDNTLVRLKEVDVRGKKNRVTVYTAAGYAAGAEQARTEAPP